MKWQSKAGLILLAAATVAPPAFAQNLHKERGNILAIVGFGFPGRFQELGTVHQPAKPFLTPAVSQVEPQAIAILERIVRPRLP